ncbi:DUF5383 family protein [Salicibibacter cibarius]|uniref:DUF5383 family protein n=1 Tax=Salicibibacter cibarius TaxID=2743000 RepID=A0A7T6Z623_9BACI|nr:type VII secretion EssA family protein [Salicibibacter cibarius]QQK77596.1 DUF5383 family protein [Salicibibacter cibarius]
MKRNAFIAGVGGVMAIAITAPASVSGEPSDGDRVEPGEYEERDVLLELSEYTEDVERGAIDVPDEQYLLEFDQPLEDDYDDIEQALFSDADNQITTAESVANDIELFEDVEPEVEYASSGEESDDGIAWIPWLLGTVVIGLVGTLFAYVVPNMGIGE